MEDIVGSVLRLLGRVIRFVVQEVLQWFLEAGIYKLPKNLSDFGRWWREESTMSKLHSVFALMVLAGSLVVMSFLVAALFGIGPVASAS